MASEKMNVAVTGKIAADTTPLVRLLFELFRGESDTVEVERTPIAVGDNAQGFDLSHRLQLLEDRIDRIPRFQQQDFTFDHRILDGAPSLD